MGLQDGTHTMELGPNGRWGTRPTSNVEKDIATLRALRRLEGGSDYWLERQERWRLWAIQEAKRGNPEPLKAYDENYAGEFVLALQPGRMVDNLAAARTIMNPAESLGAIRPGERARSGAGVKLAAEAEAEAASAGNPRKPYSPPTVKTTSIEPYERELHYGKTPTKADRKFFGAGPDEVVDHEPGLGDRYYRGDKAIGEKPGMMMTPEERAASAADRTRMKLQPRAESDRQGGEQRDWVQTLRKVFFGY